MIAFIGLLLVLLFFVAIIMLLIGLISPPSVLRPIKLIQPDRYNRKTVLKYYLTGIIVLFILIAFAASIDKKPGRIDSTKITITTIPTIPVPSPIPEKTNVVTPTGIPTKSQARIQEDIKAQKDKEAMITAYKTKVISLIQQFEAEDKIIDGHPPNDLYYDYKNDPVYIHADKVYNDLSHQFYDDPRPDLYTIPEYQAYDLFLGDILEFMQTAIHDLINPEQNSRQQPLVAEVQDAIAQAEKDIKIAEDISTTDPDYNAHSLYRFNSEQMTIKKLRENIIFSYRLIK